MFLGNHEGKGIFPPNFMAIGLRKPNMGAGMT